MLGRAMDFCLLCNKIYHMRNTFGNLFTLTSFGESHGAQVVGDDADGDVVNLLQI